MVPYTYHFGVETGTSAEAYSFIHSTIQTSFNLCLLCLQSLSCWEIQMCHWCGRCYPEQVNPKYLSKRYLDFFLRILLCPSFKRPPLALLPPVCTDPQHDTEVPENLFKASHWLVWKYLTLLLYISISLL